MIKAIKQFFEANLQVREGEAESDTRHRLQLATAALLYELIKTDSTVDDRETATLTRVLAQRFDLSTESLNEIIALAEQEAHQATSLYEFTSLINEHYDHEQKVELIGNMWQVAYADGRLDKYEESLIRRTADLIHVRHSEFIRSKLSNRELAHEQGQKSS